MWTEARVALWRETGERPAVAVWTAAHTASLSLAAGNELKVVQAMLGHQSIVLAADTYTSVLPCIGHQAAKAG